MIGVYLFLALHCLLVQGFDIENSIQTITNSHLNLQGSINQIREIVFNAENSEYEKISGTINDPKLNCESGLKAITEPAVEGVTCLANVVKDGIFKQIKTQLHCFQTWYEAVIRMKNLGLQVTLGCAGDPTCIAESAIEGAKQETFVQDQIVQISTHVAELVRSIQSALIGCTATFAEKSVNAFGACKN